MAAHRRHTVMGFFASLRMTLRAVLYQLPPDSRKDPTSPITASGPHRTLVWSCAYSASIVGVCRCVRERHPDRSAERRGRSSRAAYPTLHSTSRERFGRGVEGSCVFLYLPVAKQHTRFLDSRRRASLARNDVHLLGIASLELLYGRRTIFAAATFPSSRSRKARWPWLSGRSSSQSSGPR